MMRQPPLSPDQYPERIEGLIDRAERYQELIAEAQRLVDEVAETEQEARALHERRDELFEKLHEVNELLYTEIAHGVDWRSGDLTPNWDPTFTRGEYHGRSLPETEAAAGEGSALDRMRELDEAMTPRGRLEAAGVDTRGLSDSDALRAWRQQLDAQEVAAIEEFLSVGEAIMGGRSFEEMSDEEATHALEGARLELLEVRAGLEEAAGKPWAEMTPQDVEQAFETYMEWTLAEGDRGGAGAATGSGGTAGTVDETGGAGDLGDAAGGPDASGSEGTAGDVAGGPGLSGSEGTAGAPPVPGRGSGDPGDSSEDGGGLSFLGLGTFHRHDTATGETSTVHGTWYETGDGEEVFAADDGSWYDAEGNEIDPPPGADDAGEAESGDDAEEDLETSGDDGDEEFWNPADETAGAGGGSPTFRMGGDEGVSDPSRLDDGGGEDAPVGDGLPDDSGVSDPPAGGGTSGESPLRVELPDSGLGDPRPDDDRAGSGDGPPLVVRPIGPREGLSTETGVEGIPRPAVAKEDVSFGAGSAARPMVPEVPAAAVPELEADAAEEDPGAFAAGLDGLRAGALDAEVTGGTGDAGFGPEVGPDRRGPEIEIDGPGTGPEGPDVAPPG